MTSVTYNLINNSPCNSIEYIYEPNTDNNILQMLLMSVLSGLIDENTDCNKFKVMSESTTLWKDIEREVNKYGFRYDAQYLLKKWEDMVKCTRERKYMNLVNPTNENYKMVNLDLEIYYYFTELVNESLILFRGECDWIPTRNILTKDNVNISDTMKNNVDSDDEVIVIDTNTLLPLTTSKIIDNEINKVNLANADDSTGTILQQPEKNPNGIGMSENNILTDNVNVCNIVDLKKQNEAVNTNADEIVEVDEFSSEDELMLSSFVKKKKELKRKDYGLERLPANHWTKWWKKVPKDNGAKVLPKDDPGEIRRAKMRMKRIESIKLGTYKIRKKRKKWNLKETKKSKHESRDITSNKDSNLVEEETEEASKEYNLDDSNSQDSDCIDLSRLEADAAAKYLQTCLLENSNNLIQ